MAKKIVEEVDNSKIIDGTFEQVMHSSMIPYSEYVILDRALPRVEDGLKPVQRRILYTMMELGTTPDKPHRKSARIVGDCLGKYHPHGDSSVYNAMVKLAQPFNTKMLLVDGHGNFGSVDGDSAAAMRYTEARMTPFALEMLRDLDKNTVPMTLNFDDSLEEPEVLPSRLPNLLVNGANGIAVGLTTTIPPHNLHETINGIVAYIDNKRITLDEMMTYIPAPDFPTGGIIIDNPGIREAYATGKGKIVVR
ncbi:MAG: DNA gyrase subunit A, partial [Clostridia bacterium]|nr:DNA gyrase subunit A [Clostridia bacterium]